MNDELFFAIETSYRILYIFFWWILSVGDLRGKIFPVHAMRHMGNYIYFNLDLFCFGLLSFAILNKLPLILRAL